MLKTFYRLPLPPPPVRCSSGIFENVFKSKCFARGRLKKVRKTLSENAGEVFARRFFDFFWAAPRETPRCLDGRGPKFVSKVSDSYEAIQQKSKKHDARAPSRAKSDEPLNKNNDFGTRQRIPSDPADPADCPETAPSTAAQPLENWRSYNGNHRFWSNTRAQQRREG